MMNWTSVNDKLPETGRKVIATYVNGSGKRRTICGHYIERWTVESSNQDDCYDEYSEEKDEYFYCEGWYENIENWGDYSSVHVCEGEITHWMPLPLAPEQPRQDFHKPLIDALESALRTYETMSPGVMTVERKQCEDALSILRSEERGLHEKV